MADNGDKKTRDLLFVSNAIVGAAIEYELIVVSAPTKAASDDIPHNKTLSVLVLSKNLVFSVTVLEHVIYSVTLESSNIESSPSVPDNLLSSINAPEIVIEPFDDLVAGV